MFKAYDHLLTLIFPLFAGEIVIIIILRKSSVTGPCSEVMLEKGGCHLNSERLGVRGGFYMVQDGPWTIMTHS